MRYSKLLLYVASLMVFALMMPSVFSLPAVIVDIQSKSTSIPYNGVAEFNLEITNNQDTPEKIYIPEPRSKWAITINKYVIDLAPKESVNITIYAIPNEAIEKGKYAIFLEVKAMRNPEASTYQYLQVEVSSEKPPVVEIVTISREIKEEVKTEKSPLRKTYHLTLTHVGNAPVEDYYYIEVSAFDSFFLKAEPKFEEIYKSPEGKTMVWQYALEPGETFEIYYSVSYVPLIVAAVLVLAAVIILLSFYKSPFYVEKEIIMHKTAEAEKKNSIKIKLNVKNKTAKKQINVMIKDIIPSPLILTGDFGTVQPSSIKKLRERVELTWVFDVLEPHEERIVTYEMRSALKLLGKVLLPSAVLEQPKKGKRTLRVHSKLTKFEV